MFGEFLEFWGQVGLSEQPFDFQYCRYFLTWNPDDGMDFHNVGQGLCGLKQVHKITHLVDILLVLDFREESACMDEYQIVLLCSAFQHRISSFFWWAQMPQKSISKCCCSFSGASCSDSPFFSGFCVFLPMLLNNRALFKYCGKQNYQRPQQYYDTNYQFILHEIEMNKHLKPSSNKMDPYVKQFHSEQLQYNTENMFTILEKVSALLMASFDQTALLPGTSDIIAVRWDSGELRCTPLVVSFGQHASAVSNPQILLKCNNTPVPVILTLDKYGYVHPMNPPGQFLQTLSQFLWAGPNKLNFSLVNTDFSIECQMHLYNERDRLIISDVDGTMTKDNLGGLYRNYRGQHYLHDGYSELLNQIYKQGFRVVWVTMRSLALYQFSKDYITKYVGITGPLMTQPEELFCSLKKQVLKETVNIKASIILSIRKLFPAWRNPFGGGLGNIINDAVAYRAVGIAMENIFIIDQNSSIQQMSNSKESISYADMKNNIGVYFLKDSSELQ